MIDAIEMKRLVEDVNKMWICYEQGEWQLPTSWTSSNGDVHGLEWCNDDEDNLYVLVGCVLPKGIYVDFMDGNDSSYGEMNALRIYITNESTAV